MRALERENARLQQEIAERRAEIAAATNPAWLEEQARRLGYVRPGERVFVLASPHASLPPDGGIDPGALPTFAPPTTTGGPALPSPTQPPVVGEAPPTPVPLAVPPATPAPR